ncbi:hypothetical protein FACS1894200_14380 [Spirochaetia bacterium]|nr:hypothetical protein FACS1894200_14380 [Spirochaetia bacterium]
MRKTPPISPRFKELAALFLIRTQCGFPESALAAAEAQHGKLPALLRDYYLELGAHKDLNHTQDQDA